MLFQLRLLGAADLSARDLHVRMPEQRRLLDRIRMRRQPLCCDRLRHGRPGRGLAGFARPPSHARGAARGPDRALEAVDGYRRSLAPRRARTGIRGAADRHEIRCTRYLHLSIPTSGHLSGCAGRCSSRRRDRFHMDPVAYDVNAALGTATAQTTHLSTYGLVGPEGPLDAGVDGPGGDAAACATAVCSGTSTTAAARRRAPP